MLKIESHKDIIMNLLTTKKILLISLTLLLSASCSKLKTPTIPEKGKQHEEIKPLPDKPDSKSTPEKMKSKTKNRTTKGYASYYQKLPSMNKFTASGEIFDDKKLTAAHRELDFGTILKVTNTTNNKSVTVRINDRGPFIEDRIIDLSLAAARKIGMMDDGIVLVEIEILEEP